jgi:hypothetical protein
MGSLVVTASKPISDWVKKPFVVEFVRLLALFYNDIWPKYPNSVVIFAAVISSWWMVQC